MNNQEHLEAIKDIRNMMKRSTRFLSLSGLSGVLAGIYALAGAFYGHLLLKDLLSNLRACADDACYESIQKTFLTRFVVVALTVLSASLLTGFLFSRHKAKKAGSTLMGQNTMRFLFNLAVPLIAGGLFCIILYQHNEPALIAPCMLIFYGLALMNASKYTLDEILYLGLSEIALGLINATMFLGYGLTFWAIGFGILHIIYGTIMWFKYDRKN